MTGSRVVGEREERLREALNWVLDWIESIHEAPLKDEEPEAFAKWITACSIARSPTGEKCPTCGETGPDVVAPVGAYGGAYEARCGDEWHDKFAVLASSPSPPDREPEGLTEGEVQAILRNLPNEPGFHLGFGGHFNSAVAKLRALFGPVRGDEE